jgi:hypothetical protein
MVHFLGIWRLHTMHNVVAAHRVYHEGNELSTVHAIGETIHQGLINYTDNKAKCRHLKKIDLQQDFATDVNQRLKAGDTVSYVGIFDPAL